MKSFKKICFIATSEITINVFLLGHLRKLSKHYKITVITNTKNLDFLIAQNINANVIAINFSRKINIPNDLYCLYLLILNLSRNNFLCVHSVTPKAGLLGMLAAFLTQTPYRIHTYTGQVWANKKNMLGILLKLIDKFIAKLTTFNIVDSPSQLEFLINRKIIMRNKSFVLGDGSISGVDLIKFRNNKKVKKNLRVQLRIPYKSLVFIFLGRLNPDKGITDLVKAFTKTNCANAYLLIVGPDESDMCKEINSIVRKKSEQIRLVPYTNEPEKYLAASDVLCLPSYREGFGNVIIEAAAMGIPSIASNIYGITDAIMHNETGFLHPPKNIKRIKSYINHFILNPNLIAKLGKTAQTVAVNKFNSRIISTHWEKFYLKYII
jgi:glycosyltransferase involved in cell wall biosynthesis